MDHYEKPKYLKQFLVYYSQPCEPTERLTELAKQLDSRYCRRDINFRRNQKGLLVLQDITENRE